jgi:energy-dependent translational throttle protein EttA
MADDKKIIYSMVGVSKRHQQKVVLKNIYLSYFYGAKIGVLGLNGSGKSTLLKILAGVDTEFDGETVIAPGFTVGYLEQEPLADEKRTVREVVEEGASEVLGLLQEFEVINEQFGQQMSDDEMDRLLDRQGKVQDRIEQLDGWDVESRLEMAMDALRCPPSDATLDLVSGGERRRVALCRLLLQKPDILLLDEPTNHLDAESVAWLEHHLQQYAGTVIAVTHDRYFLDNVAGWILELDRGEGIPWKGNYSSWLDQKQERLRIEQKKESRRQQTLQRELEWIRMSPRARHEKSKARIGAFNALSQSGRDDQDSELLIRIPRGPRLGNRVFDGEQVTMGYGDRILIDHLDFSLPPGGIVGIIGPNGAGKTTFLRLLTGEQPPASGTIRQGETVTLGYVSQMRESLDPEASVWQCLSGGQEQIRLGGRLINSRAYCAQFNFTGADQQKRLSVLSGGERNRVNLALTLKEEANVLMLDEPTNDLDVNTIRALEDAILDFAGCVVVISHDRWFLDRICTHILAFEDDGSQYWFEGNFSEYEENKSRRLGVDSIIPKRLKYRSLTRD